MNENNNRAPARGNNRHRNETPVQGQLYNALKPLMDTRFHELNTLSRRNYSDRRGFTPVDRWKADGEDHINIWRRGTTELGQWMAHDSALPLQHSRYGMFVSLRSFWLWLRSTTRDERIRHMSGPRLNAFAYKHEVKTIVNGRAILMDADWQRIQQYQPLAEEIRNSELPFDIYTVDPETGSRKRPPNFQWMLQGVEEIRRALKEGRDPDFTSLMEKPEQGLFYEVEEEKKEPLYTNSHVVAKSKNPIGRVKKACQMYLQRLEVETIVFAGNKELLFSVVRSVINEFGENSKMSMILLCQYLSYLSNDFRPADFGYGKVGHLMAAHPELNMERSESNDFMLTVVAPEDKVPFVPQKTKKNKRQNASEEGEQDVSVQSDESNPVAVTETPIAEANAIEVELPVSEQASEVVESAS